MLKYNISIHLNHINGDEKIFTSESIEDASNKINNIMEYSCVTKHIIANWVNPNRTKSKKYDWISIEKVEY